MNQFVHDRTILRDIYQRTFAGQGFFFTPQELEELVLQHADARERHLTLLRLFDLYRFHDDLFERDRIAAEFERTIDIYYVEQIPLRNNPTLALETVLTLE